MSSSTFIQAGVSRRNGVLKVRFSSDQDYIAKLTKQGDSDIDLIDLGRPMTKVEALAKLVEIDFADGDQEIADCIAANQAKRQPRQPRVARKPRVNDIVQHLAAEVLRLTERIDSLEERIVIFEHFEEDSIPY